jgi:hypothetical protein
LPEVPKIAEIEKAKFFTADLRGGTRIRREIAKVS